LELLFVFHQELEDDGLDDAKSFGDGDMNEMDDDQPAAAKSSASDVVINSTPVVPRTKKSRSAVVREEDNALKIISSAMKTHMNAPKANPSNTVDDAFDVYGKFVASELRAIRDDYMVDVVKKKIGDVFFEVKWQNSVRPTVPNREYANNQTFSFNRNIDIGGLNTGHLPMQSPAYQHAAPSPHWNNPSANHVGSNLGSRSSETRVLTNTEFGQMQSNNDQIAQQQTWYEQYATEANLYEDL